MNRQDLVATQRGRSIHFWFFPLKSMSMSSSGPLRPVCLPIFPIVAGCGAAPRTVG